MQEKQQQTLTHTHTFNCQVTSGNDIITWLDSFLTASRPSPASINRHMHVQTYTYFSPFSMNVMLFIFNLRTPRKSVRRLFNFVNMMWAYIASTHTHSHTLGRFLFEQHISHFNGFDNSFSARFSWLANFLLLFQFVPSIHSSSHIESISSCKQCKITIYRINKPIIVFQTFTNQYIRCDEVFTRTQSYKQTVRSTQYSVHV